MTCLVMNPMWVVKTRFQAQSAGERVHSGGLRYRSVGRTLGVIYRERGVRGLYSGTRATMAAAPAAALQFPLYEAFKRYGVEEPTPMRIAFASASSAAVVSVFWLSRGGYSLQAAGPGDDVPGQWWGRHRGWAGSPEVLWRDRCVPTILRCEGIAGLYRGLSASLVRTVPNSAIGLLTFETLLQIFDGWFETFDARFAGEDSMPGGVNR